MKKRKVDLPDIYKPLANNYRYKILFGGRGGARSWTIARVLLLLAGQKKIRILCTREFQHSIKDSVHKLLSDQIALMEIDSNYIVQKDKIVSLTGSEFLFAGLKHNTTSIKSMEGIDICWVEEAEKVSEDSWDILIPTIRKKGSEIWISFNPDLETDPTYKRFVLNTPPESLLIKATWRDNPWFPDELLKEKDYMYSVDPERALWIWEGECRSHSDAQIMNGKWVVDVFEPDKLWFGPYFGADWGFARDPSVLVKFWIKPMNDYFDIMVEKEAFGVGVDISDTPDLFDKIEGSRDYPIYADNARPETINHMIKAGFSMIAAPKWPGCVEDGIAWLRSARKIVIHESCKHLIDEAKNYSYKIDKLTGDILPQVQKGFDHGWDAIRYGATPFIFGDANYSESMIYDESVNISPV